MGNEACVGEEHLLGRVTNAQRQQAAAASPSCSAVRLVAAVAEGFMSCCWRRVETTPVLWKGKLLRFESVRGNYGEERYERIDFQTKVQEQFMALKSEDDAAANVAWHVIDATGSIESIQESIAKIAADTMSRVADKPVGRLWL